VTLTGGDATIYPLARLGMPVTIIATPSNYSVFVVSGGNVNLNTASIDPNNPHYAFQNWSVTEGSANIAVPTNASTTATVNYGDPVLGHVQIHANYFWWN
jgi:hypothetical protein